MGFVIVGPSTKSAKVTRVSGDGSATFVWGADGKTVVGQGPDGSVRTHDLDGSLLRTFTAIGDLTGTDAAHTALGTVLSTTCPAAAREICFWDATTGVQKGTVRLPGNSVFNGWLDRRHVMATVTEGSTTKVMMLDLNGRAVRTLAEGPTAEFRDVSLHLTRR
ncbi:hypothetical protein ACFXJ8_29195 [Nonomuraea sp. NPDC059194]|uniref:hypothetical protein n=1 Tax=Nonomuraea sp. NPDC059194 TaxID=3346764 RepID=UPI00367BB373